MTTIYCFPFLESFIEPPVQPATHSLLGNWYGNVFYAKNKFHLIFIHERTRYCVLTGPIGGGDIDNLIETFRENLLEHLRWQFKIEPELEEALEDELSAIQIAPYDNNKEMQGVLRRHVRSITSEILGVYGPPVEDRWKIIHMLNFLPKYPDINELRKIVNGEMAMREHLERLINVRSRVN